MATEKKKRDTGGDAGIEPPPDDERGDEKPGFGGEGERSELGKGKPIDEEVRRRNADRNHER